MIVAIPAVENEKRGSRDVWGSGLRASDLGLEFRHYGSGRVK